MKTAIEMTRPVEHDGEEFAQWFCANNDVPEGTDPFDTMDNGMYVWRETREGLAKWLELQQIGTVA